MGLIGAHAAGINHTYKKINRTPAKCLVCGEYSECQILKYEEIIHFFYIKIKVLDEQFWFDWKKCNHRAMLYDKQDVSRYKLEQIETGNLSVPYYQSMKIRTTTMPKKISTIKIVFVVIIFITLGVLLGILFDKLGINYVF